jgi:hypothetical protein
MPELVPARKRLAGLLIRNYDWDYRLFDGVVARTAYTGRRVLGMLDCLWGCWTESMTPGSRSR